MKVYAVVNQKGGIGKTTGAMSLATGLEAEGYGPVAIVDVDPQKSADKLLHRRPEEAPGFLSCLHEELPALIRKLKASGFNAVVIDTPPNVAEAPQAALEAADYALIPMMPGPLELEALGPALAMVRASGKPFCFLLTRARMNTGLAQQTLQVISQKGPVAAIYGDRVDYPTAMITGHSANELKRYPKARKEGLTLVEFLVEASGLQKKKQ
jgi:chromosome partitioning protein